MLTFLTVLRSGGQYLPEHVQRLRQQIDLHHAQPHRHLCLTDLPGIPESQPLLHGWPGWWSKLELFASPWPGPVVYLDLDVTVRADLGWLAEAMPAAGQLASMKDAWLPGMNSSVMLWQGSPLVHPLSFDPATAGDWPHGDQQWIEAHLRHPFQPLLPPQVSSFKAHGADSASIVVYHGKPKPWEVTAN